MLSTRVAFPAALVLTLELFVRVWLYYSPPLLWGQSSHCIVVAVIVSGIGLCVVRGAAVLNKGVGLGLVNWVDFCHAYDRSTNGMRRWLVGKDVEQFSIAGHSHATPIGRVSSIAISALNKASGKLPCGTEFTFRFVLCGLSRGRLPISWTFFRQVATTVDSSQTSKRLRCRYQPYAMKKIEMVQVTSGSNAPARAERLLLLLLLMACGK
jgi:hypothetical protein